MYYEKNDENQNCIDRTDRSPGHVFAGRLQRRNQSGLLFWLSGTDNLSISASVSYDLSGSYWIPEQLTCSPARH